MNKAIMLHTFLRLARPGTIMTLIMFVLVYPTAIAACITKFTGATVDFDSLSNLIYGPMMISVVAVTFVSSSIGNTKSLDDGEYLALLFTRPIYRWQYIISKWMAGFLVVIAVIGSQTLLFKVLIDSMGKGDQLSLGIVDIGNILLNALQATALVVMIFAFPSRVGAMIFAALLYFSFAAPIMFNAIPGNESWFNGALHELVNSNAACLHSLTYAPIDLDPYFNSIQIQWLPAITFWSNMTIYIWVAVMVLNKREFFYTN